MPINETGQGQSKNTPIKQDCFQYFMGMHVKVAWGILRNPRNIWAERMYYYIDTNAGTGLNDDGSHGSTLLAMKASYKVDLPLHLTAIEMNSEACAILKEQVDFLARLPRTGRTVTLGGVALGHPWSACVDIDQAQCLNADNAIALTPALLPETPGQKLGVVYCDPNGVDDLPYDALVQFFRAPKAKNLDLLISIGATALKRCFGRGFQKYTLHHLVRDIPKRYWFVREGYDRNQWTMLYGTNWSKAPEELNLKTREKALRLRNVYSPEGVEIFLKLANTQKPITPSRYANYGEYLRTPEFLEVRARVMTRAKQHCEVAGCTGWAVDPHHLTYPIWGTFDNPNDLSNLIALCRAHHAQAHGKAY